MSIRSFFRFFLSTAIITCGVSVSLSQGFMVLAFITSLFLPRINPVTNLVLKAAYVFWGLVFFNMFVHFFLADFSIQYLKNALNQEPKDFFLFWAALTVLKADKEDLQLVYKSFLVLAILLVTTGFISLFSEYRLAWLVSSLHKEMTTWGKQHLQGVVGGLKIYLPIGLMNTHLTFGGLLLLTYPFLFFRALFSIESKESFHKITLWWILLGIGSFVFLFNNARSAMGGTAFAILIGFYFWKKKGFRLNIPLWIPVSILIASTLISVTLWNTSESFRTVVGPVLGSEKHTDSGRTFIWSAAFPLIKENPILGVGPGNFSTEIERSRKELSLQYPELLFFYETTQRGHAHNDFFHITTVFGLPTLIVFFVFLGFLYKEIQDSPLSFPEWGWFMGLFGLGLAGLLQCYFQDDEVVIVFWFLVGYLIQSNYWKKKESLQ